MNKYKKVFNPNIFQYVSNNFPSLSLPTRICYCIFAGKTSWPELVGEEGECAVTTIEKENKLVNAQIIAEGTIIIEIYICDRVLVWVNDNGIVVTTPVVG